MKLKDLSIGKRLGLGFGAILLMQIVIVAIVGVVNIDNKEELVNGINLENQKNFISVGMRSSLSKIAVSTRNIGLQTDVELMKKEQAKVQTEQEAYLTAYNKMLKLNLMPEEKNILSSLKAKNEEMGSLFNEAMKNILAFNNEGGIKIISTKIDPLSEEANKEISKLIDLQQKVISKMLDDSVEKDNQLVIILIVCCLIDVIVASLGAWWLTKSITRPLNSAVKIANVVASGDLTHVIEIRSKDETGQLLQALQNMNSNLKNIVQEVRLGTDTIATASKEIAAGNQDLSSRTEQQAASLEETASSMEELTSTVKENTANAGQANQLARKASDIAIKGGQVVHQVVDTMGSINESSKKIVDIISVIDSIAFQTNILALNAAVEAARAGEQGRGFAVVASEVRNLAQRSANAAKEIKGLINDSVEKVDLGRKLVDQAGSTMDEIVTSVKHVTDIMSEIALASQEQESGIEQVNRAISQMDSVTQQNAALVEEAAAAAQSLQDQAENLSQSVSVFKV